MQDRGFSEKKEVVAAIWEQNAGRWPSLISPWRPSAGDIATYRELSGERIRGTVLILGATPELRDLIAHAHPCTAPIIADASVPMLLQASDLLKRARTDQEIWLKCDWRYIPFEQQTFDLVLGDMIWWVLSISQQSAVARKISALLKPQGRFVSRFRLYDEEQGEKSAEQIISNFLARLPTSNDVPLLRNSLLSALYHSTHDRQKKQISRVSVRNALELATADMKDPQARSFLEDAAKRVVGADWTVQGREEILNQLTMFFDLFEEKCADDYEAQTYPVWGFRSKSIRHESSRNHSSCW